MVNNHHVLEKFKLYLQEESTDSLLVEESPEFPFGNLLVYLGKDEQERDRNLSVIAFEQSLPKLKSEDTSNSTFYTVQFTLKLPFKINELVADEMANSINFINRLVDIAGFVMDEVSGEVYFRYVWIGQEGAICDKNLFLGLVGTILLMVNLFSSTLELIATGQSTFNSLLEKIIAESNART